MLTPDAQHLANVTVSVIARAFNGSALGSVLADAAVQHDMLMLQPLPNIVPDFCSPALIDTTHMSPMELAHLLHQLARTTNTPLVALASASDGATLRLLACCPAIAAVIGMTPDPRFLCTLLRFVGALDPHDRHTTVWYEVPPVTLDPRLDINGLLVALDGATRLSIVELRLACSRSQLRRRLGATATALGIVTSYNTPQDWQAAIIAALRRPVMIG